MSNAHEFRPLNELEKGCILAAAKKGKIRAEDPRVERIDKLMVSYEGQQGGFTVCVLMLPPSIARAFDCAAIYRGASRRSYKDARLPVRGEMLAFSRAVLFSRATVAP